MLFLNLTMLHSLNTFYRINSVVNFGIVCKFQYFAINIKPNSIIISIIYITIQI